jgi:rhodanese-related sulfurtransferase
MLLSRRKKVAKKLPTITAEQLQALMDNWLDLLVINVLDEKTFNDCHIQNSVNIPFDQLQERVKDFDRAREIIVYCASYECSASDEAYKMLDKMGFVRVKVYKGGTKEWKNMGLPTHGSCRAEYLKK